MPQGGALSDGRLVHYPMAGSNTLGVKFRVIFDLGVREQDHRGMTLFRGE